MIINKTENPDMVTIKSDVKKILMHCVFDINSNHKDIY